MRWVLALAAMVFSASIPGVAFGQAPDAATGAAPSGGGDAAGSKVTAEDLYQQGLALAGEGKWAEAAARFEESNRLDRAPGTTINLADCYEHLGKLASAWTLFVEAATIFGRRTPPDPRGETAKARAEALQPKLSRLTIEVPEAVRATPGLVVKRDGQDVGAGQLGAAIAVDPGEHVVEATAPGRLRWSTTVHVEGDAKKVSVAVPALAEAPGNEGPGASGGWPWQKKVALGVAGVGAAGMVVGAAFGGIAVGNHDELTKRCAPGEPRVCDAEGVKIAADQKTVATVSTVGFAAGGALLAAGVVLWLVAPAPENDGGARAGRGRGVWVAPSVGGVNGLAAGGAW